MTGGRIRGSLLALIRAAFPRIDYYGFYRAKVAKQSADLLRVDVQPDDPRVPGMGDIPLRHGLPGIKVQVAIGAYVLIGFMGGDPSKPYVHCWEAGESVALLQLAGTTPIARLGDAVSISLSSLQSCLDARYSHGGVPLALPVAAQISSASDVLKGG